MASSPHVFGPMATSPEPSFGTSSPVASASSSSRRDFDADDDAEDMEPELVQLMDDNENDDVADQDPYALLEQKERDLILAAELGKALLERNEELQRRHDELQQETNGRIEAVEQEKYVMQQNFALRESEFESMISELRSDNQEMQKQIRSQSEAHQSNDKQRQSAVGELSEQNQRLTQQLREASAVEEQLQAQVQTLREQHKVSKSAASDHRMQMESLKQEVNLLTDRKQELERRLRNVTEERDAALASLEEANDKIMVLDRRLNETEQQSASQEEEMQELRSTNSNLEDRIERMSIQITSPNPGANHNQSLFSELEMSSASECGESSLFSLTQPKGLKTPCQSPYRRSPAHRPNKANNNHLRAFGSVHSQLADEEYECDDEDDDGATTTDDDDDLDRRRKARKQQRLQKRLLAEQETELARLREKLTAAETRLRDLAKHGEGDDGEDSLEKAWRERDEALEKQRRLELQLEQARADLMNLDGQLMEAIQQKIELSQQLERWEIDLETLIEYQVKKKMERVFQDEEVEEIRMEEEKEEKERAQQSLRSRVARKLFKSAQ